MNEEIEIWKKVESCTWHYEVSNLGRVKSFYKYEKFLKPRLSSTGYLAVTITRNKKAETTNVHRLVAEAFIPNSENKSQVNHKNGIKTDNNLANLEWVTRSQNGLHSFDIGTNKYRGQNAKFAKHSESKVLDMLKFKNSGIQQKEIAKMFDVSDSYISSLYHGRTWRHLTQKTNEELCLTG